MWCRAAIAWCCISSITDVQIRGRRILTSDIGNIRAYRNIGESVLSLHRYRCCCDKAFVSHSMALSDHISNVCRSAHFHIRALCHIRSDLTEDMAKAVAVSMVHSRLDYANSVVHGRTNIRRLQLIQNSVARAVLNNRPDLSTSELLHSLHWLPVESRISR